MKAGPEPRFESRTLDKASRLEAKGTFVALSRGETHFEERGPRGERPVVLIHGFSVPSFVWDPTFEFLSASGLHVVRYDLFGRGYSDRPQTTYGMSLFLEQLDQLLEALGVDELDLVALSMGGPIAAAFCVSQPKRVRRLVLIAPSGTAPIPLRALYRLGVLPGVGEALFSLLGSENLINAIARDFFEPALVNRFRDEYRSQMAFRGFRGAILSTVRSGMLGSFESVYSSLGRLAIKILIIWGTADRTVRFDQNPRLRALLPRAEFVPVDGCGHLPHYERAGFTNPRLLKFLG